MHRVIPPQLLFQVSSVLSFGPFAQLTTPTVSLARTEFAIFSVRGICRIHRICIGARYEIYLVWCSKYTRFIPDAEREREREGGGERWLIARDHRFIKGRWSNRASHRI